MKGLMQLGAISMHNNRPFQPSPFFSTALGNRTGYVAATSASAALALSAMEFVSGDGIYSRLIHINFGHETPIINFQ